MMVMRFLPTGTAIFSTLPLKKNHVTIVLNAVMLRIVTPLKKLNDTVDKKDGPRKAQE